MTTYNTGNPIGSVEVKDLYDNAENLDIAINSPSADVWTDRLGQARLQRQQAALQRGLPHYGAQSWLVFDGGRASAKGTWPASLPVTPVTGR